MPLKNLMVRVGDEAVSGELLITKYGLEGGAIYRLGPVLRRMNEPALTIDFKPQLSADILRERAANLSERSEWFRAWKLSAAAVALLESMEDGTRRPASAALRRGEQSDASQNWLDAEMEILGMPVQTTSEQAKAASVGLES